MTPLPRPTAQRGFTLIEVIVAMAVIALGIGALLTTLTTSAGAIAHLRDKSFAGWIALNRLTTTRIASSPPATGVTSGEVDYAGTKWLWRQEVLEQEVEGFLRINVSVARASEKAATTAKTGSVEDFPAVATAFGFFGTETGTSNGLDPTWTQTAPRNPGSLNPGALNPGALNPEAP